MEAGVPLLLLPSNNGKTEMEEEGAASTF